MESEDRRSDFVRKGSSVWTWGCLNRGRARKKNKNNMKNNLYIYIMCSFNSTRKDSSFFFLKSWSGWEENKVTRLQWADHKGPGWFPEVILFHPLYSRYLFGLQTTVRKPKIPVLNFFSWTKRQKASRFWLPRSHQQSNSLIWSFAFRHVDSFVVKVKLSSKKCIPGDSQNDPFCREKVTHQPQNKIPTSRKTWLFQLRKTYFGYGIWIPIKQYFWPYLSEKNPILYAKQRLESCPVERLESKNEGFGRWLDSPFPKGWWLQVPNLVFGG